MLAVAALVLAAAALTAGRRGIRLADVVLDAAAQAVGAGGGAARRRVGAARRRRSACSGVSPWRCGCCAGASRPAGGGRSPAIAAGSELLGAWVLLAAGGVTVLEAYTLPAAALALGAGLLALRTRPGLTSWLALGPGLAAALLPSLVSVLAGPDPQPWRRLLLGAAALGVVLAGATRRWQAPVLLGGGGAGAAGAARAGPGLGSAAPVDLPGRRRAGADRAGRHLRAAAT